MRAQPIRIWFLWLLLSLSPAIVRAQVDRTFASGFETPAVVLLNEVNANISSSKDLVELRVTVAGSTLGIALIQDPVAGGGTVLANLPEVAVAIGDLIVVHMNPGTETDELVSKTDCVSITTCYATAWDELGGASGITFGNHALGVRDAGSVLIDAVAFAKSGSASPSTFLDSVAYLQAAGQWLPVNCGGSACTDISTPTIGGISADWSTISTTASGNSVQRHSGTDNNQASDWGVAAGTFGAANP